VLKTPPEFPRSSLGAFFPPAVNPSAMRRSIPLKISNRDTTAGSRRGLRRWVQIALKPASKTFGPHGVLIRGQGLKYLIADSAFKSMQVDTPGACWLDANEHHLGLALRTDGTLDCSEWNDGRQALRLGHNAGLPPQIGGSATLSVTGNALGGGAVIF
jgi:hypothetical protein